MMSGDRLWFSPTVLPVLLERLKFCCKLCSTNGDGDDDDDDDGCLHVKCIWLFCFLCALPRGSVLLVSGEEPGIILSEQ